jgi:hypothetical protein
MSDVVKAKSWIVVFFSTIWSWIVTVAKEVIVWYGEAKAFVQKVLRLFDQPNSNPTKISSRRVLCGVFAFFAVRQLLHGDWSGFLMALVGAVVVAILIALKP